MKSMIPFPYWLWEEIMLTDPPHNRQTVFRLASMTAAVGLAVCGYWLGHHFGGALTGALVALPLALFGYASGYLMRRGSEMILRLLVRQGIMAKPDFTKRRPMNSHEDA